jgi:hypothetical protein
MAFDEKKQMNFTTPTFESEASFLKRMNLLLPMEEERIRRKDWNPERIEDDL